MPHFFLLFLLFFQTISSYPQEEFPVAYKGRFRPAEAYALLWTYELAHASQINLETRTRAIDFLFLLERKGRAPFENHPLFWIEENELKRDLNLPLENRHFSYRQLKKAIAEQPEIQKREAFKSLRRALVDFESIKGNARQELAYQKRAKELIERSVNPDEIKQKLESEFPLKERLKNVGGVFKALPSQLPGEEWISLKALLLQSYASDENRLKPLPNFTSYSNEAFEAIRSAYKSWLEDNEKENFTPLLLKAYEELEGKKYLRAHNKTLRYPSLMQLKMEAFYVNYPWILFLIFFYAIGAFSLFFLTRLASFFIFFALLLHTTLLGLRCYILERPPVSNMFETLFYVPWLAVLATLILPSLRKSRLTLFAATFLSIAFLLLIEVTAIHQPLDQLQAVLDSPFWLIIHVLLVVGSYALFLLAALFAHFYLALFLLKKTSKGDFLPKLILNALYAGTIMLIAGTLLGGIWAAQSWGRFWDWDPKESWAFISCCLYLLIIHASHFHKIGEFGLSIGAILGAIAISFTWYGVNYLIGTGLHSYGFGEGGLFYYSLFLGFEILFLTTAWVMKKKEISL